MARTPHIPATTRIGRTALRVADLESMVEFYDDVVGLAVQRRGEATATLGVDGTPLLVLRADGTAPPRGAAQAGLFHNAFEVSSRAALGAALDRIRDRWRLDGASDHGVSEALYLTDPEDNGVEIYRDRPKAEWPRSDDGGIAMGTDPLDVEGVAARSDGAARAPAGTSVGHVHLEVTSMADARAFYVDTLGFGVQMESPAAAFLAAGDYHHHVGLNTWRGRSENAGGRGLAWVELRLPDDDAVAAVRRRLVEAGVPVGEYAAGIETTDPDGITVRLRA